MSTPPINIKHKKLKNNGLKYQIENFKYISFLQAFTVVATEPIESMVPIVGEIQRLRGTYNPRTLLGCVELNCVRANTVVADYLGVPPESVRVPVLGGATPRTMVPILSAALHPCSMTQEQVRSFLCL